MLDLLRFVYRTDRLMNPERRGIAKILADREARWRHLVRHAAAHSPFYLDRLAKLDLDRCRPEDVPPLMKAELMANFDAIVTDRRVRRDDVEQFLADPAHL